MWISYNKNKFRAVEIGNYRPVVKAVFYCGVGETAFSMSYNGNRLTAYVIKQFNNFRIVPTDRLQIRNQAVEFRNCHFFHFLYLPKFICLSAERKQRF